MIYLKKKVLVLLNKKLHISQAALDLLRNNHDLSFSIHFYSKKYIYFYGLIVFTNTRKID